MTVRQTLPWPHPILRHPAERVARVDDAVLALWRDMVDTMEAMPGVGLAAPQIGESVALAVVDASDTRGQAVRLANPEILWTSDDTSDWDEASPNLPGVHARITRPARVRVGYLDQTGAPMEREFEGLWATSVQHQIDHLNGRMYFDNLSRMKREMLLKRARKIGR